ncbi:unnamed protein product [Mesocestoides corti]|uniref:SCP domain-containing protein n=1 Tax=Mesocestoides corti TaxID=53468 RepID=A0A0R3UG82_MESCO|nr:unnamed protein product [Mesocestoides corti]
MQAPSVLICVLLIVGQSRAWWSQQCCQCKDLDIVSFTGGTDEDDVGPTKRSVLSAEKSELLNLHNKYRRLVSDGQIREQPSSSKIHDLKWSTELEASAQRHADTCRFAHDSADARRTPQWDWVGQNIAYSSSIAKNVEMWFDEYKEYNYQSNYCSGVCGHYTQNLNYRRRKLPIMKSRFLASVVVVM